MRRFWELLVAFDGEMIAFCEEAYLWLYDRTGVRLGTVTTALMALTLVADRLAGRPGDLLDLFFYGALGLILILMQTRLPHAAWNVRIEMIRRLPARRAVWTALALYMGWGVGVAVLLRGQAFALAHLIDPVVFYLMLVRLRDREPPRRRRAPATTATEGV